MVWRLSCRYQRNDLRFARDRSLFHAACPLKEMMLQPVCFAERRINASQKDKSVKTMEVDGSKNIGDLGSCDVELGEELDFPARNFRIDT